MKGLVAGLLGFLFIMVSASTVAEPYLYTFSGNIQTIEVDGAFLSDIDFDNDYSTSHDTFTVGDVVEYTYLVDFDLPGFCAGPMATTYSSTCTGLDIPDSSTADYFFVDLISATKLATPTEEDTTFNFGLNLANLGWLTADSAVFVISPLNEPVTDWVPTSDDHPGTSLIGTDGWAAPNGNSPYGRIRSNLTLTSVKPFTKDCISKKRGKEKGLWISKALEKMQDSMSDNRNNLLKNASFEDGDINSWIIRSNARARALNSVINSGNYALALYGKPNCYQSVVQFIKNAVVAGKTYRVSGAFSVQGVTTGRYLFQIRWYDVNGQEIFGTRSIIGRNRHNADFKAYSRDIVAPKNAVNAGVFLMANKADGVAYFDSIKVESID